MSTHNLRFCAEIGKIFCGSNKLLQPVNEGSLGMYFQSSAILMNTHNIHFHEKIREFP